jgi:hypothetical protein
MIILGINLFIVIMQNFETKMTSDAIDETDDFSLSMDLRSDFGIKCHKDQESDSLALYVPASIFEKISPDEKLNKLIAKNFPLGAMMDGDFYVIKFFKNTPVQKIQEITDEIEKRHKNVD